MTFLGGREELREGRGESEELVESGLVSQRGLCFLRLIDGFLEGLEAIGEGLPAPLDEVEGIDGTLRPIIEGRHQFLEAHGEWFVVFFSSEEAGGRGWPFLDDGFELISGREAHRFVAQEAHGPEIAGGCDEIHGPGGKGGRVRQSLGPIEDVFDAGRHDEELVDVLDGLLGETEGFPGVAALREVGHRADHHGGAIHELEEAVPLSLEGLVPRFEKGFGLLPFVAPAAVADEGEEEEGSGTDRGAGDDRGAPRFLPALLLAAGLLRTIEQVAGAIEFNGDVVPAVIERQLRVGE